MKKLFNYLLFICFCALPCIVLAYYDLGTLGPGATASDSFAWWDEAYCESSSNAPFTYSARKSYYEQKDSYYRFIDIKIDDYVDKDYNNVIVTCKARDDRSHPITSGRVYSWSTYQYRFNIKAGGSLPVENPKTYYLLKGDSISLKSSLGISSIDSFQHSVGSELGTISYSNCSGTNNCTVKFENGTPKQDREHKFTVIYTGTNGTKYRSVVTVIEMDTKKTIVLGDIDPMATVYGDYETNVSNFKCNNSSSSVPAAVTQEGSGTKYRIKITNQNNTLNSYNGKSAVCTFSRDGKNYEYTYVFTLKKYQVENVSKSYNAYSGDVINIFSDLKIKTITSATSRYNSSALSYTGCTANASSCKVTMKSGVIDGRTNTFTLYYYDTSDKFSLANVTITEKTNTVSSYLGKIGVGSTVSTSIPASNVVCIAADSSKPYEAKLSKNSTNQYTLSIKNINQTINVYNNVSYSCTGVPSNVGGRTFTYNYTFDLADQTVAMSTSKEFELFPGETISISSILGIQTIKNFNYKTGSERGVLTYPGCNPGGIGCTIAFTGGNAQQNKEHVFVIDYVNNASALYKATIKVIEKDPNLTTRAYPGVLGFCQFDDDWEYTQWYDASGKKYSFFESEVRGARLPDCTADAQSGVPLVFKGWTKGYKAGDVLTTKTSCGSNLASAGSTTSFGQTYAPCYEMKPNVRLVVNGGTLKDKSNFKFNAADMTYIATGSSYNQEISLPDVEYSGFSSSTKLQSWRNSTTGEVRAPGDRVKYDGSVWVAVTSRTVQQVDLYKVVGLNEEVNFVTSGMVSCSLSSGSSYISVVNNYGNCRVRGIAVTPFDVYADVEVKMSDGSVRIYKYSVEDRASIKEDDNGIFNVDTDDNIEVGRNDEATLNDFRTDQCEDFFITRTGYNKFTFAYSMSTGEEMNTGIYSVYQLCPTDMSTYVGLCLDPGRRGPNEYGTGTHTKTFEFKGSQITVSGNEYNKTDDIQRNSEFGKLVTHIVTEYNIEGFDTNDSPYLEQRAAAHVAVRSMAIYTGFSSVPDPSDEVYASHYFPYQGVSDAITEALIDGDITGSEAQSIVNNGSNGNGFKDWNLTVKNHVIDILTLYGNAGDTGPTDGFSRTIDETEYTPKLNSKNEVTGYSINYKGTITAPSGSTAEMIQEPAGQWCRNAAKYGVQCTRNNWSEAGKNAGRITYNYDVTITVPDASKLQPPTTVEEEKDLSFQLSYEGGHDLVNAFIASPSNGSDNVQRMLIISTENPKVYIYFSVVPDSCDLPILDPANCPDKDTCNAKIASKEFNVELFKASGCCRQIHDETSYLFQKVCSAECTQSTMTSACNYTTSGKEKADFYKINEGAKFIDEKGEYEEAIGTCIVNVTDYFANDGASSLKYVSNYQLFEKYDDKENILNIDSYDDNRYCQVTCEEDWEFSMDSFGNFIGEDAIAAGTYFQIVSNDMFMGAKRTCYTTFINYDRFMANIVNLSNELVKSYNTYSRWSHVWTDVENQLKNGLDSTDKLTPSTDSIKCVEYFDKCPQGTSLGDYYWSDNAKNCRMVPNYGQTENASCESLDNNDTAKSYYGYRNGDADYNREGANDDDTKCVFNRYHCDGHGYSNIWKGNISGYGESYTCYYTLYKSRTTSQKVPGSGRYSIPSVSPDAEGKCSGTYSLKSGGKCYKPGKTTCTSNGYDGGDASGCYYLICPSGTTSYSGVCYNPCSDTTYTAGTSTNTPYCFKDVSEDAKTAKDLKVDVSYYTETLKCRTWGKATNYELDTRNDVNVPNAKDQLDVYYKTEEYDALASEGHDVDNRDSLANLTDDNNRQNIQKVDKNVVGNYAREYLHNCEITEAFYYPGAKGSASCKQQKLDDENVTASSYSDLRMFCETYAELSDGSLSNTFCYAGGGKNYTDTKDNAAKDYSANYNKEEAFKYVAENFKDHAKKELDTARSAMTSYQSRIYSHAQDVFDCQHFQLHNRSDDKDSTRANNQVKDDTIMGMLRSYVKINSDFEPSVSYTYDEKFFMERVDKDNILIQYTEKNDALFGGEGQYAAATDKQVDATISTPNGPVYTKLSRNYIENSYYNPEFPWSNKGTDGESDEVAAERVNKYHDTRYQVYYPERAEKQIVLCTVGKVDKGTGYATGKDGAVVPFANEANTPEWLGGRCYQVKVDYKKVHYVKSSLSNSSYYKNKGNWYVRGGDSKIHGTDIKNAISKFNKIQPSGYVKDYEFNSDEYMRWSRLGSFNVFPVSMATPRNLYQYTYTFGNIGSYHNGDLGRIMGTQKSIIQDNKRTCFYEVFEEVCLCCGYKIEPGDLVISSGIGNNFGYSGSDPSKAGGNTSGTISYYSNSVSLGDIDLGRDTTLGANWSQNSPFMYNGDDSLTTDKGHKLKVNIEKNGENIYAQSPEYAYYLTPDTLKQIRSYNDANGYDLNLDKLIVYEADQIACDGSSCKKGDSETINFQHYGSKFLVGQIDGGGIELNSYGTIKDSFTKVCTIEEDYYNKNFDMSNKMKAENCRWVDYIEKSNNYYNPTTKQSSYTWFRLAFK